MGSMVAIGTSFLIFFIALGFMWTIGVYVLEILFNTIPMVPDSSWAGTRADVEDRIKSIMVWALPILLLFASIKMLSNAASSGRD